MSAALSAPTCVPSNTDPVTKYALLQQPIGVTATSPLLADGNYLTVASPSGKYMIDSATAKAGYVFGALVYRNVSGTVDIFDGSGWVAESQFDPASATLKPAMYALDQTKNLWSTTLVLSTLPQAGDSSFPTAHNGSPKYGIVSIFTTPKSSPTTAIRSPLSAPFGVIGSNSSMAVQPGLLQGSNSTKDPKNADGFTVLVVDPSQLAAAQLIVSGAALPAGHQISLQVFTGGIPRASVLLAATGDVTVTSATQVTLNAPVVISGTLYAQNISYVPYGGSGSIFL